MNILSKTLLTTLLLVGTYTATAQTPKKNPLPPYYTGVINPQITHHQTEKQNTKRTLPIRKLTGALVSQITDAEDSKWIYECVSLLGILDGAWRVPGVIHVGNGYIEDNQPKSTLILGSYDAKFTMVLNSSSLNDLKDAKGIFQPLESMVILHTYGNKAILGADKSAHNEYKYGCN